MKLLPLNKPAEFNEYIKPYVENIEPFLKLFNKEIEKGSYVGQHPLVKSYSVFLRWPIRKLEYSYVLHQCLESLKEGMKVLDAGWGVTPLVRFFAQKKCKVYGVDINKEIIKLLTTKGHCLYDPLVNYSAQNLTNLNFDNDKFDLVTCVSVLEHLTPKEDTLAIGEMLRVLKKGGRLIITVDFVPEKEKSKIGLSFARAREGIRLLFTGNFTRFFRKLSELKYNAFPKKRISPSAYDLEFVYKCLIDPFEEYFEGNKIRRIKLSLQEIRHFWKSHWFDGCLYDDYKDYVSLGFNLKKR